MEWQSSEIEVAGSKIHLCRSGTGPELVILHRDIGPLENLHFYDALSRQFTLLLPHHPGFSRSERPEWIRSVRDIAVLYRSLFGHLKLKLPRILGLGFGGWIAAEIATFAPEQTGKLALVGAMGLKPPQGAIEDQALLSYLEYVKKGFSRPESFEQVFGKVPSSDQLVDWDICREMSFRIAWRPYMYSDTLPHLLPCIRSKALVLAGDRDQIVPLSCARAYAERLNDARLAILEGEGHLVEAESPESIIKVIAPFFAE